MTRDYDYYDDEYSYDDSYKREQHKQNRKAPIKENRDLYDFDEFSRQPRRSKERYRSKRFDRTDSYYEREDIIQTDYIPENVEYDYWGEPTIDYGAGEYTPEYDTEHEYDPGHVHQPGMEHEHKYAHERWARQRYGVGPAAMEHWTDRDGDYEPKLKAQYPESGPWEEPTDLPPGYSFYPDELYVSGPEYYRDRYMPDEDSLQKIYLRMFRNIEYNVKVPVMQLIATGALFFIFILNYGINFEYVVALGNFSPWVKIQPPFVAAILAAIFGIFLYLFPSLDREIKRTIVVVITLLLIFFFTFPALFSIITGQSSSVIGETFATTIIEFLKLAAILVYWAPMFLGVYGIWSRNSFYVGASAMFLFLIIIVLDIYLFYEGLEITKVRANWPTYVIFSIILFCYIEMSDSAITFSEFTSVRDKDEIDPEYYDHLDKIIQKYFMYFILFSTFLLILAWITLNFDGFLHALGSTQVAESLELSSIYGIILSLIVIGMVIIIISFFIRYEESFKKVYLRLVRSLTSVKPYQYQYSSSPTRGIPTTQQQQIKRHPPSSRHSRSDSYTYRNRPTKLRRY